MNTGLIPNAGSSLKFGAWLSIPLLCCAGSVYAQGFTTLDLNAPASTVTVNPDTSISVDAGGGDTYGTADSFTYLYEQRVGNFDVKVQVVSLTVDDETGGQASAKASLHLRADLDPNSANIQVSATPNDPGTNYVETIARTVKGGETNDPAENSAPFRSYNGAPYPGTFRAASGTVTPIWLRMKRTGDLIQTFCSTDNVKWSALAEYTVNPAVMPKTVYIGLGAVAHVDSGETATNKVHAKFMGYQNVTNPPVPNVSGTPVIAGNAPGVYPVESVTAVNWQVSLPADGIGSKADKTATGPIVWNSGGFNEISRDLLLSIEGQEGPIPFSIGRYATGAFDFGISPRDPVAAQQNLGPYSNPNRNRNKPLVTDAASQAWFPEPRYGVLIPTARVNGPIQWNDQASAFYPIVYQAIDSSSANYFNMDSGSFGNGVFYTRMAKLGDVGPHVAGGGANSAEGFQRAAFNTSVAWFPFAAGWMAGAFSEEDGDGALTDRAYWQSPASHSPSATKGVYSVDKNANTAMTLLQWDNPDGLGSFKLPGVNATDDGLLFLVANNDGWRSDADALADRGPQINCAVKSDGSGWDVAVRAVEENKLTPAQYIGPRGKEFSFVYIPYEAVNLVGGKIAGADGNKINSAGDFTVTRTAAGKYEITIPGKTGADGMLILQAVGKLPGDPTLVDNATLTYDYTGGKFVVESRIVAAPVSPSVYNTFPTRDSDFYFAWVDFEQPLTMPKPLMPVVLNMQRNTNALTLSWATDAPTCILETSPNLQTASWTPVAGVVQNSVTVPINSSVAKQFFRLRLVE